MKKVDILFGGWLAAPNGAAYVVNSLVQSKDIFSQLDIELDSWTLDNIIPRSFDEYKAKRIPLIKRTLLSLKSKVKKIIANRAKESLLFTRIELYKSFKIAEMVGKSYARKQENNIVFVHDIFTCYYYLKHRKNKVKTFLILHSNGESFSMLLEYYPVLKDSRMLERLKSIEKYVIDEVDSIGFVANNPKQNFIRLHPEINPKKVTFVYNGLNDINILPHTQIHNPIEICCVGSITNRKGQDLIVDAMLSLSEFERKKLHFTLIGDGPIRNQLETICTTNKLPITFVGYSKKINEFLQKADIFILPSRDEGFPISILEAMREGLPVISTNVAGIPEMIDDGINGLLAQPTVSSLVKIFKNINTYDWVKMGKNSRDIFLRKFQLSKTIESYSKILIYL